MIPLHWLFIFVLHKYQVKFSGNLQDLTEKGVEDIYNHYGEDKNISLLMNSN